MLEVGERGEGEGRCNEREERGEGRKRREMERERGERGVQR